MHKLELRVPNEKHFHYSPGQKNPLSNNCKRKFNSEQVQQPSLYSCYTESEALLLPVA